MTQHKNLDLSVLANQGITYRFVGAAKANYGYPSGTQHQANPTAVVWHITGGGSLPGLDSWFNNPTARACAHLGIEGKAVHEYVPWHVAPYQAGYIDNPDLRNPYIADWVARNQNPNFLSYGIEVVAAPSGALVPPGVHLVSDDTWATMLAVDEEIYRQLGIDRSLAAYLGHNQIDGVNRSRDPVYVYLPSDIFANQNSQEEDDMLQILGQFADKAPGWTQSYVVFVDKVGNVKKAPVKSAAEYEILLAGGYPTRAFPKINDIPNA